jgi:hypothetical protein
VAADGTRQQPIMIHRAIFGSLERFFGIMTENYAGDFPFWLAPEQIRLLPVTDEVLPWAEELLARLRAAGVAFLDTPDTYYELIDRRLPGHGEDVQRLRDRAILLDGGPTGGLLLQIFTKTMVGPIFFEIIQRKGDEGFGEGNFKALFESIELDQIRRGVVKADAG